MPAVSENFSEVKFVTGPDIGTHAGDLLDNHLHLSCVGDRSIMSKDLLSKGISGGQSLEGGPKRFEF